jgi:hypothetical protein
VRGNLLDLEHNWQAAGSPTDPSLPPPAHLRVVWKDGLPYFDGATIDDVENMHCFSEAVADILSCQKVRLKWNSEQWQQAYGNSTLQFLNLTLTNLLPAYTLVFVPRSSTLRPRRPRYDHSHLVSGTGTSNNSAKNQDMTHPPVKVKWPKRGRLGLRDFIVEALMVENIQAWAAPQFDTPTMQALAIVTAPWFASAADPVWLEDSYDHGPIKHVAVAISKLDYYLFAPFSKDSSMQRRYT